MSNIEKENRWFDYVVKDGNIYNLDGELKGCHDCYGISQLGKGEPEFLYDGVFEKRSIIAMKSLFPSYSDNLMGNSEIIFQLTPQLTKIHTDNTRITSRKKVIIVGGGPSTNEVQWENLDYDYIWSSNHFYLGDKLKNKKVDLVFLGQEVDYENKELIKYVEKYEPLIVFEPAGKYFNTLQQGFHAYQGGQTFYQTREPIVPGWVDNHICVTTKFYGVLGVGLRQLILALFLGFKEIYFVGLDGMPGFNTPHSFEVGKIGSGSPHKLGAKERYQLHYVHYWNYILSMIDDVNFYNLGEYSKHNMSKEISKKKFPLSDEIKKSVGII